MDDRKPGRWWFSGTDQPGARPPAHDEPASQRPPQATTGPSAQPASANGTALPSVSLPKGGGAIRGIDEKLTVDQASGTARLEIPVPTSPGRQGFGPKLAISYNSGQGNGPYGLGWGVTVPSITRKTSMGLPRYDDSSDSDVFILAGAEDLVPLLDEVDGQWQPQRLTVTVGATTFAVRRYRPRVEAAFDRIERWEDPATLEVHWRMVTRDNVTSLFGQTASSRIADPADQTRVFSWLLDLSFDDRGNAVSYEYKPEDTANIPSSAHEVGRTASANRYPKRIWYGNGTPYAVDGELPTDWCFEIVFDYGEHDATAPQPTEANSWPCRSDPFSTYRSGFEVRTSRTCQRILMFHRFPAELGPDAVIVRSTDFDYVAPTDPDPELPQYTLLRSVTQTGWIQDSGGAPPQTAQLPALQLDYSGLTIDDTLRTADPDSLENVIGDFDGGHRRWVDLLGEGLQGILTEDDGAWYYKQNLSLLTSADQPTAARFGPLQLLAEKPRLTTQDSQLQLTNLNGDGHLCAVNFRAPVAGWLELDADGSWEPLRTFSTANVDWQDPNLRFVDLDGDGLADVLITEDDVLTWYQWQAGAGFGEVAQVPKPLDEDRGPALVFSDGAGSVFLADMSGDGLSDLVRIRSGETSYWPNLGYGRYGAKIVMDGAPTFDHQDLFDQRRLRLADIDGSGTADLIYLGSNATTIWFNQSGNAWTSGRQLPQLPAVDDVAQASVFDLLGTGTAAIVWTSPLPDDAAQPLRYIDITGSIKPYLLTSASNNLGATTRLTYAPSTRFYLQDQAADTPWITRLPFPVHVVERVQTDEAVSRTSIVSSYTYHHGFYDPAEREFRGFARVDQLDAESLPGQSGIGTFTGAPPSSDEEFTLPPVWTRSWYHTGAYVDRVDIARRLTEEFYSGDPEAPTLGENALPATVDAEQSREACRALRGRFLRQEIYAQDGLPASVHPYAATQHRYRVDLLQPPAGSSYGAFYAWELESIACHYERDPTDPRVAHELTLSVDAYGNATASASVGYPRRAPAFDEQSATLLTYTQADFINAADQSDFYRLGLPSETRSYELTGVTPPGSPGIFDHDTLRDAADAAEAISYEDTATGTVAQRRLLKRSRTIYRKNDLSAALPEGQVESLALVDYAYQLVYTKGLLDQAFVASGKISEADLAAALSGPGAFVDLDSDGNQWAPSARILYSADPQHPDPSFASQHFYLPQGAVDPWGNASSVVYDDFDLLVTQTADAVGNVTSAQHNYRVLQPWLVTDPNLNRTGVRFDALSMVLATAAMGKLLPHGTDEGDHLDTSTAEASASDDPTTRLDYDLSAFQTWAADPGRNPDQPAPAWVHTLSRVRHQDPTTPWLESYGYSDGLGRVALTKAQAEPGSAPQRDASGNLLFDASGSLVFASTNNRWVGTGRVVYDNKGNPVKSYEPFFDSRNVYEDESALVDWGVTSLTRYDPLSRAIRVDNPDGTYKTVEFDPWSSTSSDEVDTVKTSAWYAARSTGQLGADQQDAAQKAAANQETPSVSNADTLGRMFQSVADNGADGKYATTLTLGIEGLTVVTTDALGRPVLTSEYCPGGHEVHHASVDSGERWKLLDAGGQHLLGWDSRQHRIRCEYDALRRPTQLFVATDGGAERVAEQLTYGESATDAQRFNLRGVAHQHKDEAGVATTVERDFDGNVKSTSRQLLSDYVSDVDWTSEPALTDETFTAATSYDALHRVITSTTPDGSITTPAWNERSLLTGVTVKLPGLATATVDTVAYDAKGQRLSIAYGNGSITNYAYDLESFRLVELTTTRPNGADTVQALSYTYDPVGNITRLADAAQQTIFFDGHVATPNADYEYDAIYRLRTAQGREQIGQAGQPQTTWSDAARTLIPLPVDGAAMRTYSEAYDYDPVGKIKSLDHTALNGGWKRTYTYDPASNHLASTVVLGISNPDTESYSYDAHGNITSMPHLSLMTWDWKDQLSATAQQVVTNGTPETTYYRYDASGERVLKATESQNGDLMAQRLYLGGYEVYREYSKAGAIKLERQTLHIGDGTTRICLAETVTVDASNAGGGAQAPLLRYQLGNHLGSAVLELDPRAAIISYEEYYPYGSTSFQSGRNAAEVSLKRYRYTGKERDQENGFYYHGARYYAPWLGRWISADPDGIRDGPNRYLYASGNPVRNTDGSGRGAEDTIAQLPANVSAGSRAESAHVAAQEAEGAITGTQATVQAGKGGSRIDAWSAKLRKGAYELFTTEVKSLNLSRYMKDGRLDLARLRGRVREHLAQVQKHVEAMTTQGYFNPATGGPVEERLSYFIPGGDKKLVTKVRKLAGVEAKSFAKKPGLHVDTSVTRLPRVATPAMPGDQNTAHPIPEPLGLGHTNTGHTTLIPPELEKTNTAHTTPMPPELEKTNTGHTTPIPPELEKMNTPHPIAEPTPTIWVKALKIAMAVEFAQTAHGFRGLGAALTAPQPRHTPNPMIAAATTAATGLILLETLPALLIL
jgi:RHS repeat-associated protein